MSDTAEKAIKEALDDGVELHVTTDAGGQSLTQRPVNLNQVESPKRKRGRPPKMVRVYNKYGARVFTSNGPVEAMSEGLCPRADLERPNIAKHFLVL